MEVMNLVSSLIDENEYAKAMQICRKNSNGITNVLSAGLECHQKSKDDVREAIADAGRQEVALLEKNLPVLGTIAGIAPLIGLLGTVTGMIKVFRVISVQGMGGASTLAGGISEALVTTATGLMIAIPSLVAYNYFARKAEKIILRIERNSTRLLLKMFK
jgi:biopolymer transport protein ExbB